MAFRVKWATGINLRMLIIGGAVLGVAVCAYASDPGDGEAVRSAELGPAELICEELEKRFGDRIAAVLTDDYLESKLQDLLNDPEYQVLAEEERLSDEAMREELKCFTLTAAWGIGVQGAFGYFLDTIPPAKRPIVEERLLIHHLELVIEDSTRGDDTRGRTMYEDMDEFRALFEDYLSSEELELLTVSAMLRAQFIESTRMSLDARFKGEELAEEDAEAIVDAFGREQARAYEGLLADPENYDWYGGLAASYERAMEELSQTLSAEAMEFAERFFEYHMKVIQMGD